MGEPPTRWIDNLSTLRRRLRTTLSSNHRQRSSAALSAHWAGPRGLESGNFDVEDDPRSGRPVADKVDAILEKIKKNGHISSYDIAEELGIDHKIPSSSARNFVVSSL
ncbi:hypothetical protein EVAR_12397_1 [Eumeta japonica]|uniref:Uncharacterized protein n=1 Tax=Eumeta variegata TaxID=151549 RepID=A0A4C1U0I5_EUMVA|nr:hypothetical protein EVAR_12397_1 [Eumeta japonica]